MKYFFDSIITQAYWKFALFSKRGLQSIFAWFGGAFLTLQVLDWFSVLRRENYGPEVVLAMVCFSTLMSVLTRRPTQSVSVRVPNKDCSVEVRIGDILDHTGAVVISTNTTFDTDTGSGLISAKSLQGQFEAKFFLGKSTELDRMVEDGLSGKTFEDRPNKQKGKTKNFPMGTVVPLNTHGRTFYFCAMATLSDAGTASTTESDLHAALDRLWSFVRTEGELQELAVPLIGTGRGRIGLTRERVIELIALSFKQATIDGVLTHKLAIVVHPDDAKNFQINLWEIRDDLSRLMRH